MIVPAIKNFAEYIHIRNQSFVYPIIIIYQMMYICQ